MANRVRYDRGAVVVLLRARVRRDRGAVVGQVGSTPDSPAVVASTFLDAVNAWRLSLRFAFLTLCTVVVLSSLESVSLVEAYLVVVTAR